MSIEAIAAVVLLIGLSVVTFIFRGRKPPPEIPTPEEQRRRILERKPRREKRRNRKKIGDPAEIATPPGVKKPSPRLRRFIRKMERRRRLARGVDHSSRIASSRYKRIKPQTSATVPADEQ